METIASSSCPILNTLRFCTNNSSKLYTRIRTTQSLSFLPPTNITCRIGSKYNHGWFVNSSSSFYSSTQETASQQLALLLEVEGVLMDVYRLGNRQAFNAAFRKLGLDCANWTQPVYQDLVRKSMGDEERMLVLFFNRIGWPTSLPTSEKETFMKSVLREKKIALDELVLSKTLPLRPGVEDFIDEAYDEGVPVAMLTAYCKCGEKPARSIIEKLGNDKMEKIKIIGIEEVKKSFYGQLVFGEGVASDLGERLAKEARKAVSAEEQRIAKEVASMLKLSVDIDTTSSEELQNVVAALRAGAEYVNVPVNNCVLVAGSQYGVAGAERIGMPCVVVRSRHMSIIYTSSKLVGAWLYNSYITNLWICIDGSVQLLTRYLVSSTTRLTVTRISLFILDAQPLPFQVLSVLSVALHLHKSSQTITSLLKYLVPP